MENNMDVESVPLKTSQVKPKTRRSKVLRALKNHLLLIATLLCVFMAVVIGLLCRKFKPSPDTITLVGFPGIIFMRIFKMLLLPLIVSSMVTGLTNLSGTSGGKVGLFAIIYYLSTTFIAIAIGIVLAITIRPGEVTQSQRTGTGDSDAPLTTALDTLLDLIRNLFPDNIVQAAVQHTKTSFVEHDGESSASTSFNNISNISTAGNDSAAMWVKTTQYHDGMNVTGILLFFALFGVLLSQMRERAAVMIDFFVILNEIVMKMTRLAMWYCPIGILFLIISKILEVPDLARAAKQLMMYIVTGLAGLGLHSLLVLPLIYFALTRQNPFRVAFGVLPATLTALATSSSSASLPVTLQCCEEHLQFDSGITRFVLPIGATINMDGLAIVQSMTPIFLAQMTDRILSFGDIIAISLSATLASIGAAGIPGSGFITMLVVVAAVGIPVEEAYIVLTVDWLIMRVVTMVNVYGDCLAAGVLSRYFGRSRTGGCLSCTSV